MTAWATGAWAVGAWAIGAWSTADVSSGSSSSTDAPEFTTIVHTVHSDTALLAASQEAAGYPIENVQSVKRSKVWRSDGLADSPSIRIDGTYEDGLSRGASFFGMFFHLCHGATGQFVMYPNDDWTGTPVYNSLPFTIGTTISLSQTMGLVEGSVEDSDLLYFTQPLGLWFPMIYHRSWSFFLSGTPDAPDGATRDRYQIGRLVVGPAYEFARGVDFLPTLSKRTNTARGRSGGGSNLRARGSKWDSLACNMRAHTDDDQAMLAWLMDYMADGRDGVLAIYPSDAGWRGRQFLLNGCFTTEDGISLDYNISSRKLVFDSN
jgi:hypothetical protein